MKALVEDRFSEFYHHWVWKLEQIFHQLLEVSKRRTETDEPQPNDLQPLLSKVTSHLKQYYTVKWAEAHQDVLPFFSPTWLTPLENAFSWVTGWKPSTAFRLLDTLTASFGMTEEQARRIGQLRVKVRMEEERVEREMERLHVAMADRKTVELAKLSTRAASGGGVEGAAGMEVALKGVLGGLEKAMKGADCVRLLTLKGVMDVLSPWQCVEFLAAILALQLRLKQWGKKNADMGAPNLNEGK